MKHSIGLVGLALLGLSACQQQEPAQAPLAAPPPAEPVAVAPPPPTAAPVAAAPAAPPPATADERSKWFKDCWSSFNARDYAKFQGCFAENATSEQVDMGMPPLSGRQNIIDKQSKVFVTAVPDLVGESQLTLVSGNDILSVVLLKGTNKGPLPGPQGEIPASNKKIGYLALQHVQTTPDGRTVAKERFIYDGGTFMSQIGVSPAPARKALEQGWADKPSLISAGTDAEKANIAALGSWTAAMNKRDATALGALLTDDVVFSDLASPADRVGKKEVLKQHEEMFKAFPDLKIDQSAAWSSGDYVISAGRFSGTNTGDMPSLKLKKTGKAVNVEYYMVTRLAGGKVKSNWLFTNGIAFASQLGVLPQPKAGAKPAAPAKDPKAASTPPAPAAKAPGTPGTPGTPATPASKDAKGPATPATPATPAAPGAQPKAGAAPAPAVAPKAGGPAPTPVAPPPAAAPKAAPTPAAPAAPPAAAPKPPVTK
jgi:ketosteroid isomerase-like protein